MEKARILLVDADRLLREVIGDFLRSRGYKVDIAANREEAMASIRERKYALAMLGHGSRQGNGLKLMRDMRQTDPDIFCLIMTGYSSLKTVSAAMTEGVSDYILKPFQLVELDNILQKHI